MTLTIAKFTIEQYHRMVAAGILENCSVELLNGEIVEMLSEGAIHADLSSDAADYLRELLGNRAKVREGHPITLPETNSEPEPDLAIVRRRDAGYGDRHPYPSDVFWLIEFSNTSLAKDLEEKSQVYAKSQIREYWVVNLRQMELVVKQNPVDGEYRSTVTLTSGDIRPLAFPDLVVSVTQLLKR